MYITEIDFHRLPEWLQNHAKRYLCDLWYTIRLFPTKLDSSEKYFRERNDVKATILQRAVFDGVDCWIRPGIFIRVKKYFFITVMQPRWILAFNLEGPGFEWTGASVYMHILVFIMSVPIARNRARTIIVRLVR